MNEKCFTVIYTAGNINKMLKIANKNHFTTILSFYQDRRHIADPQKCSGLLITFYSINSFSTICSHVYTFYNVNNVMGKIFLFQEYNQPTTGRRGSATNIINLLQEGGVPPQI